MPETKFAEGIRLLRQPVMPLVTMLQFLYLTGPFETVAEVINELPEPIETGNALYDRPRALLTEYLESLAGLERIRNGESISATVVDEGGMPVDPMTAGSVLVQQAVLAAELERINSLLCGQCGCVLCCIGPDAAMAQEYFEIPLTEKELALFPVDRCDSDESRRRRPADEDELLVDNIPFYRLKGPRLVHWQSGWSLILPRLSICPGLEEESGRCRVYDMRPGVCRRPQIFPYLLEPLAGMPGEATTYRIRQSLLAITDCPYVRELRDEIADYAAASGLSLVLSSNKA